MYNNQAITSQYGTSVIGIDPDLSSPTALLSTGDDIGLRSEMSNLFNVPRDVSDWLPLRVSFFFL